MKGDKRNYFNNNKYEYTKKSVKQVAFPVLVTPT